MLTLNEIRNVNFRKSNFGGYRAEDVEAFIDEVQLSYDSLLKENAELLKRLESLTAKLEEYQMEEDSIRNALMNAQKVGDASLRDAKHKAEIILKDATIKAEKIVSNAQMEIHRERDVIERMQRDIADFKARLLKSYKDHLTLINSIPSEDIMRPDTRDALGAVPMLDRDAPYSSSRRDSFDSRDSYGNRDSYDTRDSYPPAADSGYGDSRQDYALPDNADSNDTASYTPDEQPILPRERIGQSRGGFTVNIDDSAPAAATTTLPPPARSSEQRFPSFDNSPRQSYDDTRRGAANFDRTPISGGDFGDFSSSAGSQTDPASLITAGGRRSTDDFSAPAYDTGSGGYDDDRSSFRRKFS
ncbi:MAG: DivIVA domain-containing protein [Clostridia bacterium]|nr:DivIVA domain-containing protein [Clostridia bacterium]